MIYLYSNVVFVGTATGGDVQRGYFSSLVANGMDREGCHCPNCWLLPTTHTCSPREVLHLTYIHINGQQPSSKPSLKPSSKPSLKPSNSNKQTEAWLSTHFKAMLWCFHIMLHPSVFSFLPFCCMLLVLIPLFPPVAALLTLSAHLHLGTFRLSCRPFFGSFAMLLSCLLA